MIWFLANWRILAILTGIIASFGSGWRLHTIYDGYSVQKAENKAIVDLGKGEVAIVDFNAKLDKEKASVKDSCMDSRIPVNIAGLLH